MKADAINASAFHFESMKTLFKLVLGFLVLYVCAVAGSFFAGVIGAIAAVRFHAGPDATFMIVRVLSAVFFFGFVALVIVIYTRRQKRKSKASVKNPAG
jgi:membrane protein implicated in regulation of membrane protease activity